MRCSLVSCACDAKAATSSLNDLPSSANQPAKAMDREKFARLVKFVIEYRQGVAQLAKDGTPPTLTSFDVQLATDNELFYPRGELKGYIEQASEHDLQVLDALPGPWKDADTLKAKIDLLQEIILAERQGRRVFLEAEWQLKYGDRGLSSNIAVPLIVQTGMQGVAELKGRVIIGDASDAERVSRVHVRKDGSFEPVLLDGVISTQDNEHWRAQRRHLSEVFMPLSSLAQIMPISLARAKKCAERLRKLAAGSEVDMSDFLLHEAMAQLQLALMGASEDLMEQTNAGVRAAFTTDPKLGRVGHLAETMQKLMALSTSEESFALPTDGRPVHGPLSRAVQTSDSTNTADYGNMLLILFAGHDTTGHTMTWLLLELCRNSDIQRELQAEVDQFFNGLNGRNPVYEDLSRLRFMDLCITETLRMWPAVANGTFRQLQFRETVTGPDGKDILLPRGTHVNVTNWPRHRNPDLWGEDVNRFNPRRKFEKQEIARVGCPMAAANPSSDRFSPFAHSPRSCLGRNFAQMEMRLIMLYLLRNFSFSLGSAYQKLLHRSLGATPAPEEFRGVNRGTMGPMDLENSTRQSWGTRPLYALKLKVELRTPPASAL